MSNNTPYWATRNRRANAVLQTATTSSTSIVDYASSAGTYKSFQEFALTVDPKTNSIKAVRQGWKALHCAIFSGLDIVDQFGMWLKQNPYRTRYLCCFLVWTSNNMSR